jgi:mannose-6-phosphate isomerase-like protein (cupin superfamily)
MKAVGMGALRTLSVEARASVRRRKNLNLHETLDDPIQRLCNAFEPGTYVRPHRHGADSARFPRRSSFGSGRQAAGSESRGTGALAAVPEDASLSRAGGSWELFALLAGRAAALTFDAHGIVTARAELGAETNCVVEIPAGVWHSLVALAPGTVLFEVKHGPYRPSGEDNFAAWAPPENTARAAAFVAWMERATVGERAPG